MSLKTIRLYARFAGFYIHFLRHLVTNSFQAAIHRLTYRSLPDPKNVLIIGGSFAGVQLARRLADSLPSGYRVVLVERHSHFHYSFALPRYSVVPGHESKAFVPYTGLVKVVPDGALQHIKAEAVSMSAENVRLSSDEEVPFHYLALATGATQPPPARLRQSERGPAIKELQYYQQMIKKAEKIAVIGAGAVGVELASDIKTLYPEKEVCLIHSRNQLLPRFSPTLHEHVSKILGEIGVEVVLGERPDLPSVKSGAILNADLHMSNGARRRFDLVVSLDTCTEMTLIYDTGPDDRSSLQFGHAQGFLSGIHSYQWRDPRESILTGSRSATAECLRIG
jgi:NAD(P)H-nitrite reductase large subunit